MFLTPALALVIVMVVVPLVATLLLSFSSWTGFRLETIEWVAFANYQRAVSDPILGKALANTVIFVVALTVLVNVLGFVTAMLLFERIRGHNFLRVAMFLPLAVSPVVTSLLWYQIVGPYGILNTTLQSMGANEPVGFLSDPSYAFYTVVAATVWQTSGISMLIFYAGLQGLPLERLEAARLDGARYLNRILWIVLPYLRPVLAASVVLIMISGWRVFELVYVLTRGGPGRATEVLATYLYDQGFVRNDYGYASVIALLIVIGAVLSSLLRKRIAGDAE